MIRDENFGATTAAPVADMTRLEPNLHYLTTLTRNYLF